jgi:transposase
MSSWPVRDAKARFSELLDASLMEGPPAKTGRLRDYAVDDRPWGGRTPPAVVHLYAEDRKGEHPAAHLAGFEGIPQVDGYSGFKRLLEGRPAGEIRLASRRAHCRRGFYELHRSTGSPLAV